MKKIAFIVNHFNPSDLSFQSLIDVGNAPIDVDILGFYLVPNRPCIAPRFAIMEAGEAYNYTGPLVATSLETVDRLLLCVGSPKKYFYIWDLEWLHQPYPFEYLYNVLHHKDLTLVCRNQDIANRLQKVWNLEQTPKVIKDFEIWRLLDD